MLNHYPVKNLLMIGMPFFFLLFLSVSCQHEEKVSPAKGNAAFSFYQKDRSNGRTKETTTPAFVRLEIKDGSGNKQEEIKLSLFPFGQGYLSENLELPIGSYQLTQFVVLDASGTVIFATPLEGSELAKYIDNPLPIEFTITNEGTEIKPQVLAVDPEDSPELFGYASFGFELISNDSVILVKTRVVISVGGIIYENLDADIRVKGYDSNNIAQWTNDYNFIGPTDELEVKNGFHHYSIELVNKWGINDIQSGIPLKEIWDGRADGPLPITYVLGDAKNAKKLLRFVTSKEVSIAGAGIVYQPELQVSYTYSGDGRLENIHYETYSPQTLQFEDTSMDAFLYEGSHVSSITTTVNGSLISKYQYLYGAEDKIIGTLYDLTVTRVSTFNDSSSVSTNYSFSNGRSFVYEFNISYKDIVSDKVTQAGQLCHQATFTYDKNINPFRHLGYIDFNFENRSINNKLTEDAHYKACGFPVLIPVSHSYTYDEDGYPVQKITTYKGGSFDEENDPVVPYPYHSKTDFYYE
jgi:hypothetical protein